ncbi:hypothetical protein DACRYDRAFT_107158 [Dacryopinax primogenitus]|uniref:Uncharacterized protein n=1 Tax=Dacryopinax primogenitus (strain DJM 731) TaxID=1858805 RepID=M5G0G2_DACPD|nr:uncharacterized protein DACRYDRAFT_107158 [Dacryopinax primogenitus]EJU02224.1 hypothetical protein DACRYDRAFT_107158 [Dacryopinax primogenitus]
MEPVDRLKRMKPDGSVIIDVDEWFDTYGLPSTSAKPCQRVKVKEEEDTKTLEYISAASPEEEAQSEIIELRDKNAAQAAEMEQLKEQIAQITQEQQKN